MLHNTILEQSIVNILPFKFFALFCFALFFNIKKITYFSDSIGKEFLFLLAEIW